MGYSTTASGELCCDACDTAGGVRKIRCPFDWCSPAALCPSCREKYADRLTKDYHRKQGCEEASKRFAAKEKARLNLLDTGVQVRCSAINHNGAVKVTFQGKDRSMSEYLMSESTYHSIPFGVAAVVDDYKKFGWVVDVKDAKSLIPHLLEAG